MKQAPTILSLLCVLTPAVGSLSAAAAEGATSKPNIILILSDDVGLGDIHCYGGPFKTPQHRHAGAGRHAVRSTATRRRCAGRRAARLLTGRYPFRTGPEQQSEPQRRQPETRSHDSDRAEEGRLRDRQRRQVGPDLPRPRRVGLRRVSRLPRQRPLLARSDRRYTVNGKQKDLPEGRISARHHAQVRRRLSSTDTRTSRSSSTIRCRTSTARSCARPTASRARTQGPSSTPTTSSTWTSSSANSWTNSIGCNLREKTLVIFTGDNGTARLRRRDRRRSNGKHHQRQERHDARRRQPRAAHRQLARHHARRQSEPRPDRLQRLLRHVRRTWPAPKLPEGVKLDGHSFAPQIRGEKGTPREWVYVELNGKSYVRDARFKLTNRGELFDLWTRRSRRSPSPRTRPTPTRWPRKRPCRRF